MAITRVAKVSASSPKGWEAALKVALERANKTLRNLREIDVISQKATIKDGKIDEYVVELEIIFELEE
ncbi:MAG: dodecin family protein [Planctomycetota bacterium]|nr:dodecin family protein [Planctomycetota bacterium]